MLKRLTLNPEFQSLGHCGKHIPKSSHISGLRVVLPGLCRYILDPLIFSQPKQNKHVCLQWQTKSGNSLNKSE